MYVSFERLYGMLLGLSSRTRKAALEALLARGREDEASEDVILEQAKVIEAKRKAEASARRPRPVGTSLVGVLCRSMMHVVTCCAKTSNACQSCGVCRS